MASDTTFELTYSISVAGDSNYMVICHDMCSRNVQKIFLFRFGFGSIFEKNSNSDRNEFDSVRLKNCGSVRML